MYAVTDLNYIRKQVKNYTGNWSSKEKTARHCTQQGIGNRRKNQDNAANDY
jgi:hypothetical protein